MTDRPLMLTQDAVLLDHDGARRLRCRFHRGTVNDDESVRCLICGRTLAWFGEIMSAAQARSETARFETPEDAERAHAARSERSRRAALMRWHGRRGECANGHKVEGANAQGHKRPRCRACYLSSHDTCPNGHRYTDASVTRTKDNKRRCLTCRAERRHAAAEAELRELERLAEQQANSYAEALTEFGIDVLGFSELPDLDLVA